jgi:hypothetical protein
VVTTKRPPVAKRAPARKPASRGAHSAPKKRAAPRSRAAAPPPTVLQRHAVDLWSIGLITLGVLLALALWVSELGPLGHDVNTGLADLMGWTRILLPIISIGAGVVLLVERERPEPLRTGLGVALGIIGFCGLGELAKQPLAPLSSQSQLQLAGG